MAGVLSVATVPAAVWATRWSESYDLLHAGFAIPVGLAFGALAVALARAARERHARTLGRAGRLRTARLGRALGLLGLFLAGSALVSVAVYGLLTFAGTRD